MNKKLSLLLSVVFLLVTLGLGCARNNGNDNNPNPTNNDEDQVFQDPNSAISFTLYNYLQKDKASSEPGAVLASFKKKNGKTGPIDNLIFSTKTREAWQKEVQDAKSKNPNMVCENYEQYGCEKWDDDYTMYQRAINNNRFEGYYALGTSKKVINSIPFVVVVTYNIEKQQYQTKYVAFVNNTRVTFTDPATGGLEYGVPFQMTAKNRELVELTAQRLAKRENLDDVQTRARADALYQLISTIQVKK